MLKTIDTAVVGAGIAGLSAALFLGRAGRSTLVYDGGQPRILAVEEVREYLGFDGVTPEAMLAQARDEVLRYDVEIRAEAVQSITPRDDGLFDVTSSSGTITARAIVLATGVVDELPPLTGLPRKWGRDVRVCPCFDGYEVRDERFVVFGLGERLTHMAAWVSVWSPNVTVVSNHPFNEADREKLRLLNIQITPDEVTGLIHENGKTEGKLVGVATRNSGEIACEAAWIAMNVRAASGLAASLCEVDEFGIARTDKGARTSRAGVFAVGNASDSWAHLAHATASGTNVGPLVTMYLLELRLAELRLAEARSEQEPVPEARATPEIEAALMPVL